MAASWIGRFPGGIALAALLWPKNVETA